MDYILLPKCIQDISDIHSKPVHEFLNDINIIDNKIDMQIIREYYKVNPSNFNLLVTELSLRGFAFYSSKSNNILPKLKLSENEEFILVRENKDRYKNIDFELFNLGNFLSRFGVENDMYFNCIPLKGFESLNPTIDIKLLKEYFIGHGFEVCKIEKHIKNNVSKIDEIDSYYSDGKICREDNSHLLPMNSEESTNKKYKAVKIDDVFNDNCINTFINFCKYNNIENCNEITDELLEKYKSQKGVGIGKYNNVIKTLNNYTYNQNEEYNSCLLSMNLKVSTNKKYKAVKIDDVFNDNRFNTFISFCKYNDIENCNEITDDLLEKYKSQKGVGIGKYNNVIKTLNNYTYNQNEEYNSCLLSMNLKESINKRYKAVRIESVFNDNCFNTFISFCKYNNIENCNEITNELLEKYKFQKGVGIGKYNNVIKILDNYIYNQDEEESNNTKNIVIRADVFEMFKEVNLKDIGNLYSIKITKQISEIKLKDFLALSNNFNEVGNIIYSLNQIILPKEVISMFMSDEKNEEGLNILDLRFTKCKTLNEIGALKKVTRERIRQKQSKIINKINMNFKATKVVEILKVINSGKKFFTKEQLIKVIGEPYIILLNTISHNEIMGLYYWDEIKLYSFESKEFLEDIKNGLISVLPDLFKYEDYHKVISDYFYDNIYEELPSEIIFNLLNSIGYMSYGKFFSIRKLSITDIVEIVFEYYIDEPLFLDEEGHYKINRLAKKELDYQLESSLRAVEARIRDAEDIILTDNKTYYHISKINYNEELIQEIEDYLDNIKKERNIINIEVIYNIFYNKLGNLKKYGKLALYSLIRIYLGDKYKVGDGNTLDIYLDKESKRITREGIIIEYLMKCGGIVNKKDILIELNWKPNKLDDAISKSKKIISWGRDKIKLFESIVVSEEIKEQFRSILSDLMKDGFTTSKLILDESIFYCNLGEFIGVNELNDKYKINGFLKCIFDDLKGNTIFLYDKNSKYTNIFDVICNKYTETLNRIDLKIYLENLGYEDMIAYGTFDELIKSGRFVELSNVEAIAKDKFIVDDVFRVALIDEINRRMADKEYISLNYLEGIRKVLPSINFRLNANFYRSVLVQNEFKAVLKYNSDYRYDKVIVVRDTSKIDTFEDLVYHILNTEYQGDMHESKIYDFLSEKGIVNEQELVMDKKLPIGIYKHNNIKIDELGFVKIIGGDK